MRTLLCLTLMLSFVSTTPAKTIRVGETEIFKTITSALKKASDGDTILVFGGFYKEGNIIIEKSISLIGIDMPVIDGDKKVEILSIHADYVTLKGFKIQRSGHASIGDPAGVKVYDSKHVRILDNYFYDNFFSIYIQRSKHCIVKNNRVVSLGVDEQEIGNGIHCWKSDSLLIIGNYLSGNRDGIYFEFVTHSVIWRNISENNTRYGLHFMFSHNDSYFTNIFRNNGAGVAVMYTKHVTMMNNTFIENWGDAAYGLLLKEISDSYIYNNRFINNTSAIFLDGANRIIVEKNLFKSNGWGMKIQANGMDNVITKNNFIRNTFDISTNGSLVLSTFDENYWDRYEGYDLNKDQIGDVPYRPLSLFSVIVETNPPAMLLYRSFMVSLLDKSERILPSLTPDNFIDNIPLMRPLPL
ncbi:MAG: nitrous oxide reductase family maturation protein NosD [Flavobacteriales bacterium]|nr:nitrous oxide reductase family maturation protein NosD [Flavobacteriales bacterium]